MTKYTCMLVFLSILLSACVTSVDDTLPHDSLPSITVATDVELIASPAHPTSYLLVDPIKAGESAAIIATDEDAAWLLLLQDNTLGWMPTVFSNTNVGTLTPALTIDPLTERCTKYLGTTNAPDEAWASNADGTLIVQGSIYRPQDGGAFQDASLTIQIDGGGTVAAGDYVHTPLTDSSAVVLFTYALDDVTQDSAITFDLANPAGEPLFFQAAYFSNDCPDELNTADREFSDQLPIGTPRREAKRLIRESVGETPAVHPDSITVGNGQSGSDADRGSVETLVWSPDGKYLASGSTKSVIAVWRLEDGELLHTLEGHRDAITALVWAPDSNFLASSSKDGTVRVWQIEDGDALYTFDSPKPTKPAEIAQSASASDGAVSFSAASDPAALSPAFGWQPGSSQASIYDLTMNPGALTIIAGPKTDQWGKVDSAPLVTYPFTDDFSAQVKVTFGPEGKQYKLAGLGVRSVQNHKNWLRITRRLGGSHAIYVEGGNRLTLNTTPYVDDEVFLKLERRGPLFTLSYSTNGLNWVPLQKDYVFEMPKDVEIYLTVYSTANEGTFAQYSDFEVTPK